MAERVINTLLIANRGEIACRIIRSCQRLGIQTVAIYSAIDSQAEHVRRANMAFMVEGETPVAAYLNIAQIIAIASQSGCDAIHPGYGFLSENTDFAAACAAANLIFVGPPADAIAAMGSKSAAKQIMQRAGVPLIPGYHGSEQTPTALQANAEEIGYPLLIKAALGGGGKGMRIVNKASEFIPQLNAAKREAKAAFGDDTMLLEKYLQSPRHIEVQIVADQHDNCIYLADRDCSLQRRHQKVIEEAPAPNLSNDTRQAMGNAAITAAKAINYVGVGTIEFLLDQQQHFYFMEMNTRLQVEHPVTEMITGVDLVEWQLRIAEGGSLPLQQQHVSINGHAIEARIYAEDPQHHFLPASGKLHHLQLPQTSDTLRIDSGVTRGDNISAYYDPMIAKLIVHHANRGEALKALERALRQTEIAGVKHNLAFLAQLAGHAEFAGTHFSTHFIEEHLPQLLQKPAAKDALIGAILAVILTKEQTSQPRTQAGFRLNSAPLWHLYIVDSDTQMSDACYNVTAADNGQFETKIDGQQIRFSGEWHPSTATLQLFINGQQKQFRVIWQQQRLFLIAAAHTFEFSTKAPAIEQQHDQQHSFCAPMNGTIVTQLVKLGTHVVAGEPLIVMEAMKMEYQIEAPSAGHVSEFYFAAGALVNEGDVLLQFDADTQATPDEGVMPEGAQ